MLGLTAIYLVNSYYKGLMVEIPIIGHTNLSGTNGAGKTSALLLIPAFYGIEPESLMTKAAGKDNFVDRYLRTDGSMVIFQYERADGPCCSILYRHPAGSRVAYRFLKADAKAELIDPFSEAIQKGYTAKELFRDLRERLSDKEALSSQIEQINEYRAIIQNDRASMRSMKGKQSVLMQLGRRFSIGGPDGTMTQMDHLAYAITMRSKMVGRLKTMIVNTQFHTQVPERPRHTENKGMPANIRSLRDFSTQEPVLRQCVREHWGRLELQREVHDLAASLTAAVPRLTDERNQAMARVEELENGHVKLKDELDERIQEANNIIARSKTQIQGIDEELNALDEGKRGWENREIDRKQAEFAQLATYEQLARSAREHYTALTDVIPDVQRWLSDQRLKIIHDAEQQREPVVADTDSRKREKEGLRNRKWEDIRKFEQRTQQELDQAKEAYTRDREPLLEEQGGAKHYAQHPVPTEEEALEMASAEELVSKAHQHCERVDGDLEKCSAAATRADNEYRSAVNAVDVATQEEKKAESECASWRGQLYPSGNSLLAFLKRESPAWGESIGRVINEKLLERQDLQPSVVADLAAGVYGLQLNLDNISPPNYTLDDGRLRARLDDAEQRLVARKADLEAKEGVAERLRERKRVVDRERDGALMEQQKANADLHHAREHHQVVKNCHKSARSSRQIAAQKRVDEIATQLQALEDDHKAHIKGLTERGANERADIESQAGVRMGEIDEAIKANANLLEKITEDKTRREEEADKAYRQQLKSRGVDDDAILAAKNHAERAEATAKAVRAYQQELNNYREFESSYQARMAVLPSERARHDGALTTARKVMADLVRRQRDEVSEYQRNKVLADQRVTATSNRLTHAQETLGRVGAIPRRQMAEPCGDVDFTIATIESSLERRRELNLSVLQAVKGAMDMLNRNPNSQISEAWINLYRRRLQTMRDTHAGLAESDEAFLLALPADLETLLDHDVPSYRRSLIASVRAVGQQIEHYFNGFQSLQRETVEVSRKLRHSLNLGQQIPALSDIEIRLVSKVEEVGGWKQLSEFMREWQAWEVRDRDALPPESLEVALGDVIDVLQSTHINYNKESLIEMQISLRENGQFRPIRTDEDLNNAGSNGLSYLAVMVIFLGMSRFLCPDVSTPLTWPVDEIATLEAGNVSRLFAMLEVNNIRMLAAMPNKDASTLRHFKTRLSLDVNAGVAEMRQTAPDPLGFVTKLQASLRQEEPARG